MNRIIFLFLSLASNLVCYSHTDNNPKDTINCFNLDSMLIDEPIDTTITSCYYVNNDTCEVGASIQIILKQHTQIVKTSKKAKSKQQKWPGWLDATLDAVGAAFLWLTSPVRPVWGDYTEAGQNFFYDKI